MLFLYMYEQNRIIKQCPYGELGKHVFVTKSVPVGHQSGEHVEVCKLCGYEITFDTSD